MFDANAEYLPKGTDFFVEVYSLKRKGRLYNLGVRQGDLILCHMVEGISDTREDTVVSMMINYADLLYQEENPFLADWFVYSGLPCGTGFIDEESKQKALKILGGKWV